MFFRYILLLLVYISSHVSTQIVPPNHEKQHRKLNVVLFFAKYSCEVPKDPEGMTALEMHEVVKVKGNFPSSHSLENGGVIPRPACKELLRESLTSLVHFSQNALGMKTAVVSVTDSEITNDINNAEPSVPPEIRERQCSRNFPGNIFEADAHKKHPKPSIEQPFLKKPKMANLKDVITSPEHTEVFKIRVKRQFPQVEKQLPGEIVDVPLEKENNKRAWDILDIMGHVRLSFFGKLFEDAGKEKLGEEENEIPGALTEHKMDPGLFETVKTTLTALQEEQEEPLLMTVFGGHLSEVTNCESPLIQSIKHVIENTDPNSTLIVLTGYCPEETTEHEFGHKHELRRVHEREYGRGRKFRQGHGHKRERNSKRQPKVVHINESSNGGHHENATIPVFARGPHYEKLCQCSLLYDVPVVVKIILEQIAPTFEGQPLGRSKRNTFGDIRMDKANYSNFAYQVNEYYSLIFNLCIFVLFII